MLKSNIFELLNKNCRDLVIHFLEMKSLVSASEVNKAWHGLFTHPDIWKDKIKSDFAIDQTILSKLPIPDNEETPLFYKKLYAHLYRLKLKQNNLPKFIKNSYHDQNQQSLLLVACADNADDAFENTPCEEQYALTMMSIYAGCIKIPIAFLKNNRQEEYISSVSRNAIKSGNFQLVKYLLNPENEFNLKFNRDRLRNAANSGNLELVQYLLNPKNRFDLTPDQDTLFCSAASGNLELLQYLLNPENQFALEPNQNTLNSGAAKSGNLKLVQYLLNQENQFGLKPNQCTLIFAAESGNLQLVEYLLNRENQFNLNVDRDTLHWAAESGNLQLVEYLLNRENQFNLNVDRDTLHWAAQSGNLELVEYLLNRENQFGLKADQDTLRWSAESGNHQLVEYLLNGENQFNLKPSQITLNVAAKSGNLQLVEYLLNPRNTFNLNPYQKTLDAAEASENFGLLKHLLPSHMLMQQALQKLEKSDFDSATEFLQKSYTTCPSHCTIWVEYVLNDPSEFNMNQNAVRYLADTFEKMSSQNEIVASQEKAQYDDCCEDMSLD